MGQAGLIGFMYVSIGLLIMGFAVLLFMVKYELGPVSKLSAGRRWLMTLVLGSGMVAFSIKLIIITTLIKFPEHTIKRNIATQICLLFSISEICFSYRPSVSTRGLTSAPMAS